VNVHTANGSNGLAVPRWSLKGLSRATPAQGLRVFWSRIPQLSAGSAYASRQNSSTSHLPELEFASTPWMIGGSSEGPQGAAPP